MRGPTDPVWAPIRRVNSRSAKAAEVCTRLAAAAVLVSLLLAVPAGAQNWDQEPTTGLEGPFDGAGPDGTAHTADDYDGTNNAPDLRGPDGIPGTDDDLQLYRWGTASGRAGCYRNHTPNCAHTSPVWVCVDGRATAVAESARYMVARLEYTVTWAETRAYWSNGQARANALDGIRKALGFYEQALARAEK